MPNDTLAANAASMPIDRRTALGSIVAAGAMLAAPAAALAEHPDADLFALARRVEALGLKGTAAYEALSDLEDAFEYPPYPREMIVTPEDKKTFLRIEENAGDAFSLRDLERVRIGREIYVTMYQLTYERNLEPPAEARELVARAVEIENAAKAYHANLEAARVACGLSAAEAEYESLTAELRAAWRELALTPARTVAGVLAKLDAVALCYGPTHADHFPTVPMSDDVVKVAMGELAELRKAREAQL